MADAIGRSRPRVLARWARAVLDDDVRAWGLTPRSAVAVAAFPVVIAALATVAHLDAALYRFITAEDSIIEWSQVLCVVATAILLALAALLVGRRRDVGFAALFGAGTLVMVFVAGEEVSWGQRMLGLATPEHLAALNTQGETNLHNLHGVLPTLNFLWMTGAGVATALPLALLLASTLGWTPPTLAYRFVPPLAIVPAFAIPFVYRAARFVLAEGTSGSFAELVEFSLYFGLLAFAFLLLRRIATEPRARAG